MHLQNIFIYPIKSLGGIELKETIAEKRGLQYDRRYMLVDDEGKFLTQRQHPRMALLKVTKVSNQFNVKGTGDMSGGELFLPLAAEMGEAMRAQVWSDECDVIRVSDESDAFFSHMLGQSCRLVYMPDSSHRQVDRKYASDGDITAFSDGYPLLLIGSQSLVDLNSRLDEAIGWDRFRPNLVINTAEAFAEDGWRNFTIGDAKFERVKPCSRCVVTTIDQASGVASKEPLRTLAKYRTRDKYVDFGQNVIPRMDHAVLRVNDQVHLPHSI